MCLAHHDPSRRGVLRLTALGLPILALGERHAGSGVLVIPAHFPTPGAGRIVTNGKAWRFETLA